MKERTKTKQLADANGDALPKSKWLDPTLPWEKEELLDVLYWIRQAIGLFCGLLWGCIPLVGSFWIVLFIALSSAAIYGYYKFVLKVDEEEFGGHATLLQEGMFTSVMLFLHMRMGTFKHNKCTIIKRAARSTCIFSSFRGSLSTAYFIFEGKRNGSFCFWTVPRSHGLFLCQGPLNN